MRSRTIKTIKIFLGDLCLTLKKLQKQPVVFFSDAKYCGNLGEVEMEKCVYTKNANELVSSLQSQLNLLAQEKQKNSSLYTAKKCKFDDYHHCWARKCLSGNY